MSRASLPGHRASSPSLPHPSFPYATPPPPPPPPNSQTHPPLEHSAAIWQRGLSTQCRAANGGGRWVVCGASLRGHLRLVVWMMVWAAGRGGGCGLEWLFWNGEDPYLLTCFELFRYQNHGYQFSPNLLHWVHSQNPQVSQLSLPHRCIFTHRVDIDPSSDPWPRMFRN